VVLTKFYKASRRKINEAKSNVYTWNTRILETRRIYRLLHFNTVFHLNSFKYLGMPITVKNTSLADRNPILEKNKKKVEK